MHILHYNVQLAIKLSQHSKYRIVACGCSILS